MLAVKEQFDQLIASPKLPLYLQQLQQVVEQEQQKRQDFYQMVQEDDKAEFINGEIIFQSPVKLWHYRAGKRLLVMLDIYVQRHQLGLVGYEKLLVSLSRNDYEPDLCFFRRERAEQFLPDQMRFPAPDLVVEILSESTEQRDRGIKMEDYAAHGVREYWLIDPEKEILEQYLLEGDAYTLHLKLNSGTLQSQVIDGFAIPVRAIFDHEVQQQTLAELTPEQVPGTLQVPGILITQALIFSTIRPKMRSRTPSKGIRRINGSKKPCTDISTAVLRGMPRLIK